MIFRRSNLAGATSEQFEMMKRTKDRDSKLLSEPRVLKPPGLREIKQVELYTKYRPLVPRIYQDELCPRPSDKVLERISSERREKGRNKRQAKKVAAGPESVLAVVVAVGPVPAAVAATSDVTGTI